MRSFEVLNSAEFTGLAIDHEFGVGCWDRLDHTARWKKIDEELQIKSLIGKFSA